MAAPLFEFRDDIVVRDQPGLYVTHGKRALDVALVLFMVPVVLPLLGLILALTALSGGRPLYAQPRVGRDGEVFRCWKVRTMIPDADAALAAMLDADPRLAEEWSRTQKLRRDPRVTRLGVLLRRTSLDELPQLWNVLAGSMSLVGPRPFTPEQRRIYHDGRADADYFRMRPGITGLWQVSRRNRGCFAERVAYDAAYFDRLSLWTDVTILMRTVAVMLRATGV